MTPKTIKLARTIIEMGTPEVAGKGIADIILFLLKRIEPENRAKAIRKLKFKIWELDEINISSKKTPASASLGQALTFIKTILNGHNPHYIRSVLSNIVRNLNA